jgi:hypothetical protein
MSTFPLQKGKNARTNENRNLQKYINFYRVANKRQPVDRITEDGVYGPGTEAALREVVAHSKSGQWGQTTTTANVQVSRDWYNGMLDQLRKAGWTPYGDSPASQPSNGQQSQPSTTYAAGQTPDEVAKKRKQTRNIVLSLLAVTSVAYTAAAPEDKRLKRLPWSLGLMGLGTGLYYGIDALFYFSSDKKKYITLLKEDLLARLAAGEKLTYHDSTYTAWANQIEKIASTAIADGTDEVMSIGYKIKSLPDMLALEIAYGLRKTYVPRGWLSPLSYIEAELSGQKQSLRELLSIIPDDKKKDLNRHLAQFQIAPIA